MSRLIRLFIFSIALLLIATLAFPRVPAYRFALPQADEDALFNQAVDAYKQNQFTQATSKFQQVTGAHAQEAQQYISNIKSYREALDAAHNAINRSPDEQDPNNLAFAIQEIEQVMKIKPDGPGDPAGMLAKARELKAQFEKKFADNSKAMASDYCAKALTAAQEHRFKDAKTYICAVSHVNPGYSCGGDEAINICQIDTELAKMDRSTTVTEAAPSSRSSAFEQAKAAYDKNDFERARSLFQRADAASKADADQYLDQISRFNDAIASGEKLSRENQYDQAHSAFLSAAAIKPDGPGDPQVRASTMELFLGLDRFYSGDYASAIQYLQNCSRAPTPKQSLARFYLGASELAKFFVTGSEDASLHQEALNDLKLAKQAGFKPPAQDLSPKILQAYKDLSF